MLRRFCGPRGGEIAAPEPVRAAGRGEGTALPPWAKRLVLLATFLASLSFVASALAQTPEAKAVDYRSFSGLDSRTVVWIVAELHLMFGAFVLGVPLFACLVEIAGVRTRDARYDALAREFTKLLVAAFSTTASLGGLLTFVLFGLYPKFMHYLTQVFHGSMYVYALLFFAEAFTLYLYYYGWGRLSSRDRKGAGFRRGAWYAAGFTGAGLLAVLAFGGTDLGPLRVEAEKAARAISLIEEKVRPQVEALKGAPKREEAVRALLARATSSVKAANREASERDRLREPQIQRAALLMERLTLEALKSSGPEALADNLARRAETAAADDKLAAYNRSSDLSARHWTRVLWAALIFLASLAVACYATSPKALHVYIGLLLNLVGVAIMMIANSWSTFMMSPTGVHEVTREYGGTLWGSVTNPLWNPLNIHRFIANVAFGGFLVGAYAAVRFLGAKDPAERAHYDWMGYIGNFVGIAALIPLPFAGYYLGREVYSASPVMGNNMMGGAFSWTFIIQAVLIGMLFIGANFYLWNGMGRIAGAERYTGYIKYLNVFLIVCFAVWLTPHNLPLSSEEQILMGGQYHPVLKYLGLMPAKNAVVNFIILSTFFSFLLYRRANKGKSVPFGEQGAAAKGILAGAAAVCLLLLFWYARVVFQLNPTEMDLPADRAKYIRFTGWLLAAEMAGVALCTFLTFRNLGAAAQMVYLCLTVFLVTGVLGVYGFVIMTQANPFLRNLAVIQALMVVTALILVTTIDIFLFRKAEEVGGIRWGQIPARAQYALITLCVSVVLLMGLMGFIRSGLREDWHIYGVLRDVSEGAFTPTMTYMAWVVGAVTVVFLGLVAFVFWLASLGQAKGQSQEAAV